MISSKKFFAEYKNSEKLNIMRIKSGRADNMIRLATELPKAAGNSDIYRIIASVVIRNILPG